ncbi:MAG: YajQ family cyclic di-GMP-binding protein [Leptospiraceae bacterium]|nr:YajQ family cyclic di-GMP-binding protein [Leptospiraceae bacterium]MCP5500709.1 YajQ family cyclic di-GMP-binding protein [Leptospiraceae bacterium]
MADSSFDIVSKIDRSELSNAVALANTELNTRFDFKGSKSEVKLDEKDITIISDNDIKLKQVIDVFQNKLIKRGIGLKAFNFEGKIEASSGQTCRMKVKVQDGLEKDHTKEITKLIKDSKIKVQVVNMGDCVRVSSKKKDDLQEIQKLLKSAELKFDVQFTNYK